MACAARRELFFIETVVLVRLGPVLIQYEYEYEYNLFPCFFFFESSHDARSLPYRTRTRVAPPQSCFLLRSQPIAQPFRLFRIRIGGTWYSDGTRPAIALKQLLFERVKQIGVPLQWSLCTGVSRCLAGHCRQAIGRLLFTVASTSAAASRDGRRSCESAGQYE